MSASFFLDKVSSKVLTSGVAGKYIKIKRLGFKNKRPSEKASMKKKSYPIGLPLTIWGDKKDDNQQYFLSRGHGRHRRPAPAQKIWGILESSLDEGQRFQPCAVMQFSVGQEVAQVGWAMPSDGQALNGDGVSLLVGQTTQRRLAWRSGYLT